MPSERKCIFHQMSLPTYNIKFQQKIYLNHLHTLKDTLNKKLDLYLNSAYPYNKNKVESFLPGVDTPVEAIKRFFNLLFRKKCKQNIIPKHVDAILFNCNYVS